MPNRARRQKPAATRMTSSVGGPAVPAASLQAARTLIAGATRVLVLTHVSPDGDAIGSLLGFGLALRAAGKEVALACDDPVPENFRFLPAAGEVTAAPEGPFDLVAAVDVSDAPRMGHLGANLGRPPHRGQGGGCRCPARGPG